MEGGGYGAWQRRLYTAGMATPFSTEPVQASGGISGKVIAMAAAAVLLVLVIVGLTTLRRAPANPNAVLSPDVYASQVEFGSMTLSEATNGTGGKVTYVDGTVANHGSKTLSGATVQVAFATGDGSGVQRQTVPLTLIRTRPPYVDLEPVSAEPVGAGQSREFRLIFETVPAGWDTQVPQITLVGAVAR